MAVSEMTTDFCKGLAMEIGNCLELEGVTRLHLLAAGNTAALQYGPDSQLPSVSRDPLGPAELHLLTRNYEANLLH